jgi:hypothetical protein
MKIGKRSWLVKRNSPTALTKNLFIGDELHLEPFAFTVARRS